MWIINHSILKVSFIHLHLLEHIQGKQNKEKGLWVGEKEDITSDFLDVAYHYFSENSVRNKYIYNVFEIQWNKAKIGGFIIFSCQ